MAKLKVAVIFGGYSSEHEVSLLSAYSVMQNMAPEKYEIIKIGITKKGRWLYYPGPLEQVKDGTWETHPDCVPAIISPDRTTKGIIKLEAASATTQKIDVVFPVLHGKNGEDGTIQGLFTLAGIPYVGCGVLSSAVCMDKEVANTLLEGAGLAHAKWLCKNLQALNDFDAAEAEIAAYLGYPIFVKPANAGSSVGVSKADDKEALRAAISLALAHDHKVIFEQAIDGQEIECAVLGNEQAIASLPGEIVSSNHEFYDYEAKYISGASTEIIPADIGEEKLAEVQAAALKAYAVLGCSGLTRADFFLERGTGRVLVNELNTLPGFTQFSMYSKLMAASGVPYPEVVDRLIDLAFARQEGNHA
ncbi:D-alanine--D-alanine ligase [Ruminococcaceae bacterium OttesenSCG-928-N02]|nr:D-alanine--D-alanine ligase [Ruminococcaceae bacterium OttesenSCG-928-N02]